MHPCYSEELFVLLAPLRLLSQCWGHPKPRFFHYQREAYGSNIDSLQAAADDFPEMQRIEPNVDRYALVVDMKSKLNP
jgi:hypothetical protein